MPAQEATKWGIQGVKDWFIRLILDALKVDGVFAVLPFEPTIGVGVGPRIGSVRVTCDVDLPKPHKKGHAEWVGDPSDIMEEGPLVILRRVQEEAIFDGMKKE